MDKPICYKPYKTTLLIEFDDGKKRTVEGVEDYGIIDGRALYYIKHGMRSFLPSGIDIVYFGPVENYGEDMAKEKTGGTTIIEIDGERMARDVMRNMK